MHVKGPEEEEEGGSSLDSGHLGGSGFLGMGSWLDWVLQGDWNVLRLSLQQQKLQILS